MSQLNCTVCNKELGEENKIISCDSCRTKIHLEEKCSGLGTTESRAVVLQKRSLMFFCDPCRNAIKHVPAELNKISVLEEEIKTLKAKISSLEDADNAKSLCTPEFTYYDDGKERGKEVVNEVQEIISKSIKHLEDTVNRKLEIATDNINQSNKDLVHVLMRLFAGDIKTPTSNVETRQDFISSDIQNFEVHLGDSKTVNQNNSLSAKVPSVALPKKISKINNRGVIATGKNDVNRITSAMDNSKPRESM